MENKPKIDGLGWFARWVAPALLGSVKAIVNQIPNNDVKQPLTGILEQIGAVMELLSDDNKDNAAQVKAWAAKNGVETAKDLGLLIVELLKAAKVDVPMFITDWLKTI